jgi:hypothetical protein
MSRGWLHDNARTAFYDTKTFCNIHLALSHVIPISAIAVPRRHLRVSHFDGYPPIIFFPVWDYA